MDQDHPPSLRRQRTSTPGGLDGRVADCEGELRVCVQSDLPPAIDPWTRLTVGLSCQLRAAGASAEAVVGDRGARSRWAVGTSPCSRQEPCAYVTCRPSDTSSSSTPWSLGAPLSLVSARRPMACRAEAAGGGGVPLRRGARRRPGAGHRAMLGLSRWASLRVSPDPEAGPAPWYRLSNRRTLHCVATRSDTEGA
jgi:hypothetical protein